MKKIIFVSCSLLTISLLLSGCWTTQNVASADFGQLASESAVVFTRGESYTPWFGSKSPWKYFEVIYSRLTQNEAGQSVVEVGIRYKGGTSWTDWWDSAPRSVTMGAQCNFYRDSRAQLSGPAIYSTNREQLVFRRGETYAYRAVSPVKGALGYQLVIGE